MGGQVAGRGGWCGAGGLLLAAIAGSACAPSLSTFQTAAVPEVGHYTAAAALEGSVPVGSIYDTLDAAQSLSRRAASGQLLSTDEKWQVFDAGARWLLSPPSVAYHLSLGYVPVPRVELSLRSAGSAWRLGARYQLLQRD